MALLLVSGAATRLDPVVASFTTMMGFLGPDQLAQLIFLQSNIPPHSQPLVREGVRTVKPAAFRHFSQEMTQIELPHQVHVPLLITVGQNEPFLVQQAAREMRATIQGAMPEPGQCHAEYLLDPLVVLAHEDLERPRRRGRRKRDGRGQVRPCQQVHRPHLTFGVNTRQAEPHGEARPFPGRARHRHLPIHLARQLLKTHLGLIEYFPELHGRS